MTEVPSKLAYKSLPQQFSPMTINLSAENLMRNMDQELSMAANSLLNITNRLIVTKGQNKYSGTPL